MQAEAEAETEEETEVELKADTEVDIEAGCIASEVHVIYRVPTISGYD